MISWLSWLSWMIINYVDKNNARFPEFNKLWKSIVDTKSHNIFQNNLEILHCYIEDSSTQLSEFILCIFNFYILLRTLARTIALITLPTNTCLDIPKHLTWRGKGLICQRLLYFSFSLHFLPSFPKEKLS